MVIFQPKLFRRKVAKGAKANCPRPLLRFQFLISKLSKNNKTIGQPAVGFIWINGCQNFSEISFLIKNSSHMLPKVVTCNDLDHCLHLYSSFENIGCPTENFRYWPKVLVKEEKD